MARIVVLGGAESGVGAAVLAKVKGFDVFLSDKGKIADSYISMLEKWEIPYEQGQHSEELILNADEIVKSPGIPGTAAENIHTGVRLPDKVRQHMVHPQPASGLPGQGLLYGTGGEIAKP